MVDLEDNLSPASGEWPNLHVLDPGPECRVVYGLPYFAQVGPPSQGMFAVRSRHGDLLEQQIGTSGGVYVGAGVAVIEDVTGDGRQDLMVSSCCETRVLNGQDYSIHHVITSSNRYPLSLGDLDGNGQGDVHLTFAGLVMNGAFQAPAQPFEIQPLYQDPSWAFPGLLWTPAEPAVMRPFDDVDGDGVREVVISYVGTDPDPWYGIHYDCFLGLHSGATGDLLDYCRIDHYATRFGRACTVLEDFTGDGVSDLIVSRFQQPNFDYFDRNQALLTIDGDTFEILEELRWIRGHPDLDIADLVDIGETMRPTSDVNGNGSQDLLVRVQVRNPGNPADIFLLGQVLVLDGATHEPLYEFTDMDTNPGQTNNRFGTVMQSAGDVDGDGWEDFVISGLARWGLYSTRPRGVVPRGVGRPALDGRVPVVGVEHPVEQSRGSIRVNLSSVPNGQDALLLVGTQRQMVPLPGGGSVLQPSLVVPVTAERRAGPHVGACVDFDLPKEPDLSGERRFVQWVVPQVDPATGARHLAYSRVLELTLLP